MPFLQLLVVSEVYYFLGGLKEKEMECGAGKYGMMIILSRMNVVVHITDFVFKHLGLHDIMTSLTMSWVGMMFKHCLYDLVMDWIFSQVSRAICRISGESNDWSTGSKFSFMGRLYAGSLLGAQTLNALIHLLWIYSERAFVLCESYPSWPVVGIHFTNYYQCVTKICFGVYLMSVADKRLLEYEKTRERIYFFCYFLGLGKPKGYKPDSIRAKLEAHEIMEQREQFFSHALIISIAVCVVHIFIEFEWDHLFMQFGWLWLSLKEFYSVGVRAKEREQKLKVLKAEFQATQKPENAG